MLADLKPYPAYKDSGVPWLGDIPTHWTLRRMKTVVRERTIKGFPNEPLLAATQTKGVVAKEKYENRTVLAMKDLHLLKLVCSGDFVISLRSFQGGIEYARQRGIISPAYTILSTTNPETRGYLSWLFKSKPFIENLSLHVTGIRQGQNVDYERLGRSYLPLSSSREHEAIVRFLNYADRRIQRYTRAKQRLIALLNEEKQAITHRAVTRGLDPDVRLKPSGVEWLGDVPEHWRVLRVKQVSQILRGKFTHRPRNDPSLYDGLYPFIQTGEVARADKSIQRYRQTLNDRGLAVSKMFPSGTLVMTIAANIGDVAVLDFEACFPDSIVGFLPRCGVERDYLYYMFRAMKLELLREAPVNTQGNLNVDRVGSRGIALPPRFEQVRIVQAIEAATVDMDRAIATARREIELLREYRTRLIADVVTGKLDVRGVALPDRDESDLEGSLDITDEMSEDDEAGESGMDDDADN